MTLIHIPVFAIPIFAVCLISPVLLTEPYGIPAQTQTAETAREDSAAPEKVVSEFFALGSGPAGPRDFDRMRSLFATGGRVITIRRPKANVKIEPATAVTRSIDEYIQEAQKYLATNPNYERVVKTWVERYANLAQVFCAFEASNSLAGEITFRGVGSFQLLWDGKRWWILTAYWQGERPNEPLPTRYRRQ